MWGGPRKSCPIPVEGECCLTLGITSSMEKLWILSLKTKVIPLAKDQLCKSQGIFWGSTGQHLPLNRNLLRTSPGLWESIWYRCIPGLRRNIKNWKAVNAERLILEKRKVGKKKTTNPTFWVKKIQNNSYQDLRFLTSSGRGLQRGSACFPLGFYCFQLELPQLPKSLCSVPQVTKPPLSPPLQAKAATPFVTARLSLGVAPGQSWLLSGHAARIPCVKLRQQ